MNKEFYDEIARLLDIEHEYHEPPKIGFPIRHDGTIRNTYKTRWNGRTPGNGRFPNHGIVRVYSEGCIHVALTSPPLTGQFPSVADALVAIERAVGEHLTRQAHAEIDALLKDAPPRFPNAKWRNGGTTDDTNS